jgi:anti-anti-sigma regulatory factor
MRDRFRAWLNDIPLQHPIERRQAPLVQIMLLVLIGASLLAQPLLLLGVDASGGAVFSTISNALLLLLSAAALFTIRRGRFTMGVGLAALAFLPGQLISLLSSGLRDAGLLFLIFALPIALVGLLLGRRGLVVTIGVSIGLVALVAMLELYAPALVGFAPGNLNPGSALVIFTLLIAVLGLFLDQFGSSLRDALNDSLTREQELEQLRASLEATVAARTAELQARAAAQERLLADQTQLLAEVDEQRTTIRELSVPVLPISTTALIMPLVGALDTERLHLLQTQALQALQRSSARNLILDITGVAVVDTQVAQGLLLVVAAARLLGATVVLVGIRPEVAQALVGLGVDMGGLQTFGDLQSALGVVGGDRRLSAG